MSDFKCNRCGLSGREDNPPYWCPKCDEEEWLASKQAAPKSEQTELAKARAKIAAVEKVMGELLNAEGAVVFKDRFYNLLHAAIYSDQWELSTHDELRDEVARLREQVKLSETLFKQRDGELKETLEEAVKIEEERNALRHEVARLKAEIDKSEASVKTMCRDWAEDDTEIKAVCAPFGIDTVGDSYGVPTMAECVIQLGEKLAAMTKERDELKAQVQFYLDGCAKAEKISEAHINRVETAESRCATLEKALADMLDRAKAMGWDVKAQDGKEYYRLNREAYEQSIAALTPAKPNEMKIYHISKNYVKCEVWNALWNGQRFSTSSCTPKAGLSLKERQAVIRDYLRENHGLILTKCQSPAPSAAPQQMEGK